MTTGVADLRTGRKKNQNGFAKGADTGDRSLQFSTFFHIQETC